jgi:hypothetical protein
MNISKWISSLFKRPASAQMVSVQFFDVAIGRAVSIPACELRPGCIQIRLQGSTDVVWADPSQLKQGEIQQPPFNDAMRADIKKIQMAFAEHRNLTVEEWEDGFRRDTHPDREIAMWLNAADVYRQFAWNEMRADRRDEIYGIIVACLTAAPDSVWHVIRHAALTKPEVEQIIQRYYGGEKVSDQAKG